MLTKQKLTAKVTVGLILLKDNSILLLRRFNTGYADGLYGLVAGCVDKNESIITAMIREAKEEAAIILKPEWLTMSCVIHASKGNRDTDCIDFFFVTSKWENMPINNEPHKCDDMRFFPLDGLPANIMPVAQQAINNMLKGINFSQYEW